MPTINALHPSIHNQTSQRAMGLAIVSALTACYLGGWKRGISIATCLTTAYWIGAEYFGNLPYRDEWSKIKQHPQKIPDFINKLITYEKERNYRPLTAAVNKTIKDFDKQQLQKFLKALIQKSPEFIARCMEHVSYSTFAKLKQIKGIEREIDENKADVPLKKQPIHQVKQGKILDVVSNVTKAFVTNFMRAHDFSYDSPPPTQRWAAIWNFRALRKLVTEPISWTLALFSIFQAYSKRTWVPYLGTAAALSTVLFIIRLFNERFSQKSIALTNFTDLTAREQKRRPTYILGRDKEIKEIHRAWKIKKTPLLIAPSGEGKSQIIKKLMLETNQGKHPELAGRRFMQINASDLAEHGAEDPDGEKTRIQNLLDQIRGIEHKFVFIFENFHDLMVEAKKPGGHGNKRSEFQTSILENPNLLCIAAATKVGYEDKMKGDVECKRRFYSILVEPLPEEKCQQGMQLLIAKHWPHIKVTTGAIDKIIKLVKPTKELGRISQVEDLLMRAVVGKDEPYLNQETKAKDLEDQLTIRYGTYQQDRRAKQKLPKSITQLKKDKRKLEGKVNTIKTKIAELKQLRLQQRSIDDQLTTLAHNGSHHAKKIWAFLDRFVYPAIQKKAETIEAFLKKKNISLVVDAKSITSKT